MGAAFVLHFLLLALIAVNVSHVLGWSVWSAAAPLAVALAAAVASWRSPGGRDALLRCFGVLGIVGLAGVAATLAWPAWQVIDSGASDSSAGRLAPMFVAALALYSADLWIDSLRDRETESGERIARFLAGPRLLPALIAAVVLASATVLALEWTARGGLGWAAVSGRVLERGIIPPTTVLLFFWGLLLLLGKWWNVARFGRALAPSPGRRRRRSPLVRRISDFVDGPGEGDERMRYLWRRHDESYLLPRYLCWALPVLGFIGTVLGISLAADGIRRIIASESGVTGLSSDLGIAIAPLGIAFDTTLVALTLSVFLTLAMSLVQKGEARALSSLERRVRNVGDGI